MTKAICKTKHLICSPEYRRVRVTYTQGMKQEDMVLEQ